MREEAKLNQQINFLKITAIILIIVYHIQCLFGGTIVKIDMVTKLINSFGSIGVTLFFVLSGYGIYKYISHHENQSYFEFIKSRFKKLAKPYYFCLIISLIAMGSAIFLQKKYILDLVTHFTFTHNLFVSTHGSINGCLWTMGTIFQFYLFAPILYRLIKKHPFFLIGFALVISTIVRVFVYKLIYSKSLDGAYYFVYGRQLITTIETFVIGMIISKYECVICKKYLSNIFICLLSFAFLVILAFLSDKFCNPNYMLFFAVFYTILSITAGFFVFGFCNGKITNLKLFKKFSDLYKYEYNIYLWHFLIIANLLNTEFIRNLRAYSSSLCSFALLLISVLFGMYISVSTSKVKK